MSKRSTPVEYVFIPEGSEDMLLTHNDINTMTFFTLEERFKREAITVGDIEQYLNDIRAINGNKYRCSECRRLVVEINKLCLIVEEVLDFVQMDDTGVA